MLKNTCRLFQYILKGIFCGLMNLKLGDEVKLWMEMRMAKAPVK